MNLLKTSLYLIISVGIMQCTNNPVNTSGGNGNLNTDKFTIAKSSITRVDGSTASAQDIARYAESSSFFGFDLFKAIDQEQKNICISPYSLYSALVMALTGAENETEKQIRAVLHSTLSESEFFQAQNATDLFLKNVDGVTLTTVNQAWGQTGWPFLPTFLDNLALYFGAGMYLLNYQSNPDSCRIIINDWIKEQTQDKIENLIPEGSITGNTALVLTNAVYFYGTWQNQFDKSLTSNGIFFKNSAEQVTVPMMNLCKGDETVNLPFYFNENLTAVELKYQGNRISMLCVMPDKEKLPDFEKKFDHKQLDTIIKGLKAKDIRVTLPKFKFHTGSISLKEQLEALGMTDAFSNAADFSGIDGSRILKISDVFHKTFIGVDEAGTEAAAATAVILDWKGLPEKNEFSANKPFLFFIRDTQTGTILFMGRVMEPEKE